MRLIDADALEERMNNQYKYLAQKNSEYDLYTCGYYDAVCEVEDAPCMRLLKGGGIMASGPDLKPCPFCGSKTPTLLESVGDYRPFHILCGCGGRVGWFKTMEECIEAWNRRASDGKTPEETKRALVTCTELVMPKEVQHQAMLDALSYIQQLEAANAELLNLCKQLEAKCHQLERERDSLIAEFGFLERPCGVCKHLKKGASEAPCNSCMHILEGEKSRFEWRGGVKEDEP